MTKKKEGSIPDQIRALDLECLDYDCCNKKYIYPCNKCHISSKFEKIVGVRMENEENNR